MDPPREIISLLITSILGGLALTQSINELQTELATKGSSIPIFSILYFLVFLSLWLRFIPGNISHIRKLERWPNSSVNTWLLDISVITAESMIIVFMAGSLIGNVEQLSWAVAALLFLDSFWLAAMLPGAREKVRPEPQWIWLWLNIPSAALVMVFSIINISYTDSFGLRTLFSSSILAIFFGASAIADIYRSAPDWFGRPRFSKPSKEMAKIHEAHMKEAIEEARKGLASGGIPIGAVLAEDGTIIGRGYNKRVQEGNPIAHAEVECLKMAGRRQSYESTILYTTLMPCCFCAGAILLFGIKTVVVGESRNFEGARSLLETCGVTVVDLDNDECHDMLKRYIKVNKSTWNEDIGKS